MPASWIGLLAALATGRCALLRGHETRPDDMQPRTQPWHDACGPDLLQQLLWTHLPASIHSWGRSAQAMPKTLGKEQAKMVAYGQELVVWTHLATPLWTMAELSVACPPDARD